MDRTTLCRRAISAGGCPPPLSLNPPGSNDVQIEIRLDDGLSATNKASMIHVLEHHQHTRFHVDMTRVNGTSPCLEENLEMIILECILRVVCSWKIRVDSGAKRQFALKCMLVPLKPSRGAHNMWIELDERLGAGVTAGFLSDVMDALEDTPNSSFKFGNPRRCLDRVQHLWRPGDSFRTIEGWNVAVKLYDSNTGGTVKSLTAIRESGSPSA